ncbi:AMP-binding protein [Psychrobacillus sp. FSL H8-0483]|uniref:AMP-binding protein n=1 Tax=Psychrobacillus sp. FSL H8-0483 TaxID=2921389 RepID=UPI00315AE3B7
MIVKLLQVLHKINLLSPFGLYRFISSIYKEGINIMLLLNIAERTYGDKIALVDGNETLSYKQLSAQCQKLSMVLKESYNIQEGHRVAFLCKNHVSLVQSIFAVSRLGADIYLLNSEMSKSQFNQLVEEHHFNLLVYDYELNAYMEESPYSKANILSYHDTLPAINNLLHTTVAKNQKILRSSTSKIILLTSGTTGKSKEVTHKPSILNFLNPFSTLLNRLNLLTYNTAYIATPIYHGYGIAILFSFIALGKKVVINDRFNAENACRLIREHNVEVITVVPLMIHKMLQTSVEDLKSLVCIASGGAKLNPKLVEEVSRKLGDVLYNLYGTSEAGLNIIATPQDLKYSTHTIGKEIKGVQIKIVHHNKEVEDGKIGQFYIKNKWSMKNGQSPWIKTGDLGYRDSNGYYFLCGRTDDMVVSAGVNIYPIDVEQVLIHHPFIEDVAVIGISDEKYGQTLKAFIQPRANESLHKEALIDWLRPRVAKFQLPKDIVFVHQLPYTALGKIDKKRLG